MMDTATIRHLSNEAARRARRKKIVPLVLAEPEDVDRLGTLGHRIPNLGDHRPKGWKLVDQWFCDKQGFGGEGEPALTLRQLKERMKERLADGELYGYGMIEEGEFQVMLGVFEKVEKKGK